LARRSGSPEVEETAAARTLPSEIAQGIEESAEDDFVLVIVDGSFENLK
jgi:hypothetical protein